MAFLLVAYLEISQVGVTAVMMVVEMAVRWVALRAGEMADQMVDESVEQSATSSSESVVVLHCSFYGGSRANGHIGVGKCGNKVG